ncbi:MAG: alpha/beta fold hydrolase [Cyanobacteria bacterium P01_A01_bin.135]
MKLRLLALTGLAPFFGTAALAQTSPIPQAISGQVIDCPMPLAPGDVDGETVICGQIQVPENWDDPNSPTLTLTYARLLSDNLSPIDDPIIFFAGGPGGSVLAAQGSFGFDFNYLRETRDVIVWDQRGNRYSSDLRCPEAVQVPDAAARDAANAALDAQTPELTLASDAQAFLSDMRQGVEIEGYPRCADYFEAQGRDLTQYNTANTVRDAIALMNYLGDPAYNLFGISYGTQISLAIMDYYGASPAAGLPPLRSAVIDGIFPVNISSAGEALVEQRNILRVFADCEADAACGAAYPNIRQRAIDLLAQLEREPITVNSGATVTLEDLQQILFSAVTQRSKYSLIPYLPRMVDELARGDATTYRVTAAINSGQISARPPTAAAALTNPLTPITAETAALAEELRGIANRLDTLGTATSDLAAAIDEAETLPQLYISLLERYLASAVPSDRQKFSETVITLYIDYPQQQTRAGLLDLTNSLEGPVADELTAVVNLMSESDIRSTWEAIADDEALQKFRIIDNFTNITVKCNDRGPTYDLARTIEELRNSEAPQLVRPGEISTMTTYEVLCPVFGIEVGEYAIPPAVTSTLRTLVINAAVDHATPVEDGELAFGTLPNAVQVTVPMTDHGATRYSECAQDIAHTFFLYPNAELDTSCVEAFRPDFVLPRAPLPAMVNGAS